MSNTKVRYRVARYARLSREDGDKLESDSIVHQLYVMEDFCLRHPELELAGDYADDGYTGTNFRRPDFQRMIRDIEAGKIDCVIVKDLSRFGRDYIDMGYYLERYFPTKGVRFIAVNDGVDSLQGPYDMMLPLKNIFNAQYARDISDKVRSSFKAKQRRGEFVGAFASYGYVKDPDNRNRLIVDPVAAKVVRRIFDMAAEGIGQVRIAKILNSEHIPCPSEYKRLMGEKYTNSRRLETTCYWTYATVHRMLQNEMYTGKMVSSRSVRPTMHGKAKAAGKDQWIVVPGTHEPIVTQQVWNTVQAQIANHSRAVDFAGNVSLFAGFLTCGDCGRAMCKTARNGRITYSCGSYHRYGSSVCSSHYIRQDALISILLADLNRVIAAVSDLRQLVEQSEASSPSATRGNEETQRLETALARIRRLKQSAYEDYKERLLSKEDYLRYKADYDRQERDLSRQLEQTGRPAANEPCKTAWSDRLAELGTLEQLDRPTLAQTVRSIRVFEDKRLEITYLFSEQLRSCLEEPYLPSRTDTSISQPDIVYCR